MNSFSGLFLQATIATSCQYRLWRDLIPSCPSSAANTPRSRESESICFEMGHYLRDVVLILICCWAQRGLLLKTDNRREIHLYHCLHLLVRRSRVIDLLELEHVH